MSRPELLGQCTACRRKVYRRDDHPESPEWYRPASKGPLRPHVHDTSRVVGRCSLCSSTVQRAGDGVEKVRGGNRGKLVPHRHAKPFEIVPHQPYRLVPIREEEAGTGEWRGWEVYADRVGAL